MTSLLHKIEAAKKQLQQGGMIILMDHESRENEGDLVLAAEQVTPSAINFMAEKGKGLICLSLTEDDFERLNIPMMARRNTSQYQTAFGVSFESATGVTTGISAKDRAHTIKVAINKDSGPQAIIMPGHVFPLKAVTGGVLERPGHTEGSIALCELAGLQKAAVICEILKSNGDMARLPELKTFSKTHGIPIISIEDLIDYYKKYHTPKQNSLTSNQLKKFSENLSHQNPSHLTKQEITIHSKKLETCFLPTKKGHQFSLTVFRDEESQKEHIAIVSQKHSKNKPYLVRLHSECLTGDIFGSTRCDCGYQLELAMDKIAQEGGILLYLRQEGRGIGLLNKIKAYALQENGLDTVEANEHLGFAPDLRDYKLAAHLLKEMKIDHIHLLTNNPDKVSSLEKYGIHVESRIPLETEPTPHNIHYLMTKRNKMGHWLQKLNCPSTKLSNNNINEITK